MNDNREVLVEKRSRFVSWGPWIISGISLFVALSSSAIALQGTNTVDSGDIKNGAVKTQDIANGGVGAANLASGSINPGTIGHHTIIADNLGDGSVWGRKLNTLKIAYGDSFAPLTTSVQSFSATCPNGSRLISGGAFSADGGGIPVIESSYPDATPPGNNPQTWKVAARTVNNAGANYINVYALCLDG